MDEKQRVQNSFRIERLIKHLDEFKKQIQIKKVIKSRIKKSVTRRSRCPVRSQVQLTEGEEEEENHVAIDQRSPKGRGRVPQSPSMQEPSSQSSSSLHFTPSSVWDSEASFEGERPPASTQED